jgi:hypothetical protein
MHNRIQTHSSNGNPEKKKKMKNNKDKNKSVGRKEMGNNLKRVSRMFSGS